MATTINPSDQTITQYNIQTGGASNLLNNVAPSATSGVPVISQGSSSQPVFGTAVVAGGGTGQVTLTNHGVLIGQSTSAIAATAAGSAGQVLQSGGASADPVYSTATYPSTAGSTGKILISDGTNIISSTPTYPNSATGTGKILRADGTNWVASTATYPDTAGTSGNVLTSDGTNWVSSAPTGAPNVFSISGTLTNAQIKALHATPVAVIPAIPGKVIFVLGSIFKLVYGGTNAFTNAGAQPLQLTYGSGTGLFAVGPVGGNSVAMPSAAITTTANNYSTDNVSSGVAGTTVTSSLVAAVENVGIYVWNLSATEIAGNAANNNTITYTIAYMTS